MSEKSVNCFLCDQNGFDTRVDLDNSNYMDVFPILSPPKGKFFKIRPFAEYPEKEDVSKPRPCVHFQENELRIGGFPGGSYHRMNFGWSMDQVIYVCPSCLWCKKNESDIDFLQRLDKALIAKIDKEVLYLVLAVINDLRLFSFASLKMMRRRFERMNDYDRVWMLNKLNELYPIFAGADQKRSGTTKEWMNQLAKVVRTPKSKTPPASPKTR